MTTRREQRARFLVLGGTAEAMVTTHALSPHFDLTYSLAGATQNPRTPANVPVRIGGFGGIQGLQHYCEQQRINAIVDCTHPFAARISQHAVASGWPVFRLERPAWTRMRGDRWIDVPHMNAASMRLQRQAGPIALALGKGGERIARLLGDRAILRRWSTDLQLDDPTAEADWLHRTRAKVLVCKNAGGTAFGKLIAARRLGVPVMMIQRPKILGGEVFHDVSWLVRTLQHRY